MAKLTFKELNDALDAAIEVGGIYNPDFQDMKTYAATRNLDADFSKAREDHYYPLLRTSTCPDDINDLMSSIGSVSIVMFPSKKMVKLLAACDSDNAVVVAINAIIEKWAPVADKFRTLKPMIIKGRKPSTTPRVTPERTLDNTGTCACCGNNVKLSDGKIVNHGFTIRHGWQEGACHGVGCDPIEVSPEGLHRFMTIIIATEKDERRELAFMKSGNSRLEGFKLTNAIASSEQILGWLKRDAVITEQRIAGWKPQPLPTGKV